MIRISRDIIDQIFQHGLNELPVEACGYLAGKDGTVSKIYPMKNIDNSREHFSLDPQEQFGVMRKSRNHGLDLIAVYHTHPETPARPSKEDIALAFDPEISYVIGSLSERTIKSFKIQNKNVIPEELIVGGEK